MHLVKKRSAGRSRNEVRGGHSDQSFFEMTLASRASITHSNSVLLFPRSIFFLHVMKTGGSTLHAMLNRLADSRPKINYFSTEGAGWPKKESPFWGRDLSIVVVRNPIDRVVSHYWQLKPSGAYKGGADRTCTGLSFYHMYCDEFLTNKCLIEFDRTR